MKKKQDVTIYDIAKKLKVSPSTVSRALKDNPLVSKTTRKKIQSTAKEMGFQLNTFASNLRKQKTSTIGVVMHELRSTFMTQVLSGIEGVTNKAGYDLIIAHSSESYEKEVSNVENLFNRRVDGLIAALAFETPNLDHYKIYKEKGIPVIFYDRVIEHSDYPKIITNNFKSGYDATQHLINQGCSRIALITASLARNVYSERHRGYLAALEEAGIKPQEELVLVKDLSEAWARAAAQKVIQMNPRPDGVFITNDFSAVVFMQTLTKHGIRIPEDIAIVGFNNDPICRLVTPQLSTINYPGEAMGKTAANHLINILEGKSSLSEINTITLKSDLIIRASSLKAECKK